MVPALMKVIIRCDKVSPSKCIFANFERRLLADEVILKEILVYGGFQLAQYVYDLKFVFNIIRHQAY